MRKTIINFLLIICGCTFCNAQQIFTSGGFEVKSEISVDWVLGGNFTGVVTQDLGPIYEEQQKQLMESGFTIKVYPTQTSDFVTIEIYPSDSVRLVLELYDNSGLRVLDQVASNQSKLELNLIDLPAGFYLLKVTFFEVDQPFKVEKIVKI